MSLTALVALYACGESVPGASDVRVFEGDRELVGTFPAGEAIEMAEEVLNDEATLPSVFPGEGFMLTSISIERPPGVQIESAVAFEYETPDGDSITIRQHPAGRSLTPPDDSSEQFSLSDGAQVYVQHNNERGLHIYVVLGDGPALELWLRTTVQPSQDEVVPILESLGSG
jgi:hypothetical protein